MNIDLDDIEDIKMALNRLERLADETKFHEMIPGLLVIRKSIDRCIKEDSIKRAKKDNAKKIILSAIKSSGKKGISRSDLSSLATNESSALKHSIVRELMQNNLIYAMRKEYDESKKLQTFYFINK